MKQFKGTKGNWEQDDKAVVVFDSELREYQEIAGCTYCTDIPEAEQIANAQLIAAAPELLEALEDMSDSFQRILEHFPEALTKRDKTRWAKAEKAINKALGK